MRCAQLRFYLREKKTSGKMIAGEKIKKGLSRTVNIHSGEEIDAIQVKQAASYVRNARGFRNRPSRLCTQATRRKSSRLTADLSQSLSLRSASCCDLRLRVRWNANPQGSPLLLCIHVEIYSRRAGPSVGYITMRKWKKIYFECHICGWES